MVVDIKVISSPADITKFVGDITPVKTQDTSHKQILNHIQFHGMKVNMFKIKRGKQYYINLEHETGRSFQLKFIKCSIDFDAEYDKKTLYGYYHIARDISMYDVPCYSISMSEIITYCYHTHNFDLSSVLSPNGLKLVKKLLKIETNRQDPGYIIGCISNRGIIPWTSQTSSSSYDIVNGSNIKVNEDITKLSAEQFLKAELYLDYELLGTKASDLLTSISFDSILAYMVRSYLGENVDDNDTTVMFTEPTEILTAIKVAADTWEDDRLMFIYHKLNKLPLPVINNSGGGCSESKQYYHVKQIKRNNNDFGDIRGLTVDSFDEKDKQHMLELYKSYCGSKQDKVKFRKSKSSKHISQESWERYVDVYDTRYWNRSHRDESDKGKFGDLSSKMIEDDM